MDIEGLFNDRDFETLMFPVMSHKGKASYLELFPRMKTLSSFDSFQSDELNTNDVIRYIILAYDRESPIMKKFMADEVKRKTWAARYAGWQPEQNGIFNETIDNIMRCKNKEVNAMIIEYIRLFNDPEWASLVVWYESLFQKLENLLSLASSNDPKRAADIEKIKGDLQRQTKTIGEDITAAATQILRDNNTYLKRDLFCTIDAEIRNRLKITPERRVGIE